MTAQPITSEQQDQYRRFVEVAATNALKEGNPDRDGLQRLFGRGGEFQAHVLEGILRFSAKEPDFVLARSILGNDFIAPEEIAAARSGIVYVAEDLDELERTLPPQAELEWLRDNGFMLAAKPPQSKTRSLLEIRELKPDYFYTSTGGWYSNDRERFAREERTGNGWLKLRKGPVPNSMRKNWNEQQSLLSGIEYVPDSAQVAWGVTTYHAVRGVYLFPRVYVRTSSLGSDGHRVDVGCFGAKGLYVNRSWDDYRDDSIGLASARK